MAAYVQSVGLRRARVVTLAGCLAGLALLSAVSSASGATYLATRTDDPVPNGCKRKDCSLREAVIAANAAGGMGGSRILLRPGRRYELTRPGPGEDASLTGDLDVTAPLTVGTKGLIGTRNRKRGTKLAVIDGNHIDRVFDIHGTSLKLIWTIVRDGHARMTSGDDGNGGAVRGGDLRLHSKSRLVGNVADGNGGAFATTLNALTGSALSGVLLKRNTAAGNGGAIYVEAGPRQFLPVDRSRMVHNRAGGSGGAIFGSGPAIRYSTIADNRSAVDGGGIALIGSGGGVLWSTVSGNRAAVSGGGIDTTASRPGAEPGLFLSDSTIASNRAGAAGGGVAVSGDGSSAFLTGNTVARNRAGPGRRGGGLYVGSGDSTAVQSTILALNVAGATASDCLDESSGLGSRGHNLIGNPAGCPGFGVGDLFGGRLRLGKLADNGGAPHQTYGSPLRTIALLRGSRAIDRAGRISAFDERGVVRGRRQDIGAYERVTRRYRFGSSRHAIRCTRHDPICAKR